MTIQTFKGVQNQELILKADHDAEIAKRDGFIETLKALNESLKDDYDKLAAECAALKARAVIVPTKIYVKDMRCNVVRWSAVIDALSAAGVAFVRDDGELIAGTRETPATDAALAEFKALGVEIGIAHLIKKFEGTGHIGAPVMALEWLAAQLRAGVKG